MLSLRDTQSALCIAIRSGSAGDVAHLIVPAGIEPEQRLAIYRNNHRIAGWSTLQATYPVVERLGGGEWFRQSAGRYQDQYASRSGDLQDLGAAYAQFLHSELAGTSHTYFGDVAALEWAYQLVLTAPDSQALSIAALQAVDPEDYERLVLVPRSELALVDSPYPIFAIWNANRSPEPSESEPELRLDSGTSRVLLIRRKNHVEVRELSHGTYVLLQQFERREPLGAATEAATAADNAFDLQLSLRELLGLEAIADVVLSDVSHDD